LTAETVIEPLEDVEEYQAFEEAVAAGFDPQTAVERELILRLASLLWRLRRATSIETGLFKLSNEITPAEIHHGSNPPGTVVPFAEAPYQHRQTVDTPSLYPSDETLLLVKRFLRLTDLGGAFDRITRYELTLWRQVRQVLLALDQLRRRRGTLRSHSTRDRWSKLFLHTEGDQ
jgi:hypothetical protein